MAKRIKSPRGDATDARATQRPEWVPRTLQTGSDLYAETARYHVETARVLDDPASHDAFAERLPSWSPYCLRHASLSAVLSSYFAVEALINEIYLAEKEDLAVAFLGLDPALSQRLALAWNSGAERLSVREKIDLARVIAAVAPIDWQRGAPQRFTLLTRLRNELVHHKARWTRDDTRGAESTDKIERQLHEEFPEATWTAISNAPYRWDRCLGLGCARWAWTTARELMDAIAIPLSVDISLVTR